MQEQPTQQVEYLDPAIIVPDPENVRVAKAEAIQDSDLRASIRTQGIIQPIIVRPLPPAYEPEGEVAIPARYMVVVGHRRHAAAQAESLSAIPAIVREGLSEAEIRLIQYAENDKRADMNPLDAWSAIEAAGAAGLGNIAIAMAINRSERQVEQFRAMGRLHPDLKAYIRETNDVPEDRLLRIICQADPGRQADAFHGAREKGAHYGLWQRVASALHVKRIPLSYAIFDTEKYAGPTTGDLFEDPKATFALDVEAFMDLQTEQAEENCAGMLKKGFADAVILKPGKYGGWEAPDEAESGYGSSASFDSSKKLPKRADRPGLIYAVAIHGDGHVEEFLYRKKQPKPKASKEEREAAKKEAASLLVDGVKHGIETVAFTAKGVAFLEEQKRKALAAAFGPSQPFAQDIDVLMAALAFVLRDNLRGGGYNSPRPPDYLRFIDEEGRFSTEGRLEELVVFARELLAHAAIGRDGTDLDMVQRLGQWLGAPVSYPATEEALGHIKGPGLALIGKSLRFAEKAYPTQKAVRAAIASKVEALTSENLAVIGWQTRPMVTRFASGVRTGMSAEERGWSDEQDTDPDFCGKREGTKACPCGWPEDPCDMLPPEEDEEGEAVKTDSFGIPHDADGRALPPPQEVAREIREGMRSRGVEPAAEDEEEDASIEGRRGHDEYEDDEPENVNEVEEA